MKAIDDYLKRATGKEGITEAITEASELMSVAMSTIHRWRKQDKSPNADHCLFLISAINKRLPEGEKKLGVKDIAIICNWNGAYR